MRQTLFVIPSEIAGVSVFGFGWLLAVWAIASTALMVWLIRRDGWNSETRGYLPALLLGGAAIAFLLPNLVLPEAGGLPIRGYGVLLLTAVLSGVGLSVYRARQMGVDPEIILSLATWLFLAGIIGARLFYVIEYWGDFLKPNAASPELVPTLKAVLDVTKGGLVVYGSLLAGGLALVVFVYKHKLPGLAMSDLIAPGVVLGMAVGRIGCFLNGCCYGGACELPWAVRFPAGSPPHLQQVHDGQIALHGLAFERSGSAPPIIASIEPDSPAARSGLERGDRVTGISGAAVSSVESAQLRLLDIKGAGSEITIQTANRSAPARFRLGEQIERSRPVHPTQLYSAIDAGLLCLLLLAYYPFRRRDGELTALVLTIHPISRFLIEVIRIDEAAVFNTSLSISQNISLVLLAGAVALWAYIMLRPARLALPPAVAAA